MPTRKTGTVTGASLEKATKGKKGALTGSTRVTGESTPPPTETQSTPQQSTAIPTPASVVEVLKNSAETVANIAEKGSKAFSAVQGYTSRISESIKGTEHDRNPLTVTNGQVDTSTIIAAASAEIDGNVPQLDSAEATQRNIIIARQRNYVGVAINNVKLKQDLATLDNEQQRLIGMLIDGKTTGINNEKKAVTYHRAVVGRDTEISKLEQDRELLTQQKIRTEGTQHQTALIQEQESLKVAKLREEIEKQGFEIQNIAYEKERLKQEVESKFLAGF